MLTFEVEINIKLPVTATDQLSVELFAALRIERASRLKQGMQGTVGD